MAFLNRKRIHGHSIFLLALLMSAYALLVKVDNSKASDFLQFYVSGSMVLHHQASTLYDKNSRLTFDRRLAPNAPIEIQQIMAFPAYGPQVALFFAPFAVMPLKEAEMLWKALVFAIYIGAAYALWRASPKVRCERDWAPMLLLAVAAPGFASLLTHSQTSVLVLLAFTIVYFTFPKRRFWSGVALGILAYKPQFGIMAACVFVLLAEWRVVLGAITCVAAQVAAVSAVLGPGTWSNYITMIRSSTADQYRMDQQWFPQMVSLRSFWEVLVHPPFAYFAYAASAGLVAVLTVVTLRKGARSRWKLNFALLLVATILVSPHAFVYDLVFLLPAFLFAEEEIISAGKPLYGLRAALYGSYLLPLLSTKLGVVALFGLFVLLYRRLRSSPAEKDSYGVAAEASLQVPVAPPAVYH